jgi:Cu/Ag efflux protein CusF
MGRGHPVLVFVLALAFVCVCARTATAADAKGKIKSVTAERSEIMLVDDASKTWTVVLAMDCKFRVNDLDSKIEDLQAGDEITITYEKDGDRLVAWSVRATRK